MQDFTVDALVLLVVKYRGNFNSLCNPSVAGLGIAISDPEKPPIAGTSNHQKALYWRIERLFVNTDEICGCGNPQRQKFSSESCPANLDRKWFGISIHSQLHFITTAWYTSPAHGWYGTLGPSKDLSHVSCGVNVFHESSRLPLRYPQKYFSLQRTRGNLSRLPKCSIPDLSHQTDNHPWTRNTKTSKFVAKSAVFQLLK